jgi:hypothetical protein
MTVLSTVPDGALMHDVRETINFLLETKSASADLAEAWAESPAPPVPGSESAKTWAGTAQDEAEEAAQAAAEARAVTDAFVLVVSDILGRLDALEGGGESQTIFNTRSGSTTPGDQVEGFRAAISALQARLVTLEGN